MKGGKLLYPFPFDDITPKSSEEFNISSSFSQSPSRKSNVSLLPSRGNFEALIRGSDVTRGECESSKVFSFLYICYC